MLKLKRLDLEISNPCNEHCIHCYRTCDSTKRGFLSVNNVKKIFDDIKDIRENKINVIITGGEVLLNNEWRDIFKYCISQNARISLFTNGSLMSEKDIEFLTQYKDSPNFREVQISLYSLLPEIHEKITGLKDSCKKSLSAIKMLKAAEIPVFVSCPVMSVNKDSVFDMIRYMDNCGINNSTTLFIFPNSDYKNKNSKYRLSHKDLEFLYQRTSKNNFELSYVWGYNHKQDDILEKNFYESAASGILVSGDGSIFPMIGWYKKIGNIHKDSLADIFLNNSLLKECRRIKIGDFTECRQCEAIGYCSFCPTTHLTANHGKLRLLNHEYCEYVHLIKQMAERRDADKKNKQH